MPEALEVGGQAQRVTDEAIALAAREAATSWDWAELVRDGGNQAVEEVVADLVREALTSGLADEPGEPGEPSREEVNAAASALMSEMSKFMQPGSYGWHRFAALALRAAAEAESGAGR